MLDNLLKEKGYTKYRLSKESGVSTTTILDICNGNVDIRKCAAGTVMRIAQALNVSMERVMQEAVPEERRCSFEVFKSNTCHLVKDLGDLGFLEKILKEDPIQKYYRKKWYPEAFYLLGMLDYLSRVNDIEICTKYNPIRKDKLKERLYPLGIVQYYAVMGEPIPENKILKEAIPEFLQYNIVESEVRNVC